MSLSHKVSRRLWQTFVTTTATLTCRAYGLNNTDITAELFPTGGIKDDYERKFYIAGVTILTVFVLFMVYGALHEVDEDLIDYDGRRRRRKERKRLRRERRRLARPHPCEKRVYDVTASADDLLHSMRSQYGCKCLCTCEVHIADPNQGSCQRPQLIQAENHQVHSENNNCEARRLYQSSDPGKRTGPAQHGLESDVWLKRQSYLHASNEFCIVNSHECLSDDVFLCVEGNSAELQEQTPYKPIETSQRNSDSREKSSNEVNLISFLSFDESPSHAHRVTSGDVRGPKPVTEDHEDVWVKQSSLEQQNIGAT